MNFYNNPLEIRRNIITTHPSFKEVNIELNVLIDLVDNLSNLILMNGNIGFLNFKNRFFIIQTELIDSSYSTLLSIRQLIEFGHFSDINVLIRKIRDDAFLFLYLLEVVNTNQFETNDTVDKRNVYKWLENKLRNLTISDILTYLSKNKVIKKAIENHNLRKTWIEINGDLNNFVHGNGRIYSQLNYTQLNNQQIDEIFKDILFKLKYIFSVFIVLLVLIKPTLIASTDYIDALDLGIKPEEGSQYYVAPFIQEFIDIFVIKIHPDLKCFLKDHTIVTAKLK